MPRKKPPPAESDVMAALPSAFDIPDMPPAVVNGAPNPDHFRALYAAYTKRVMAAAMANEKLEFNAAQVGAVLDGWAKMHGIDPKVLVDARSEADKNLDAVTRLIETQGGSLLEETRERLEALAKVMDECDSGCAERFEAPGTKAGAAIDVENGDRMRARPRDGRAEKKSQWAAIFRLAAHLNERAACPVPERTPRGLERSVEAAWLLRYTAFVTRDKQGDRLLSFSRPHFEFACEAYMAYNELEYVGGRVFARRECDGLLAVMPPGVGKSTLGAHFIALRINLDPNMRLQVIHAGESMAAQSMSKVKIIFDRTTAQGRRNAALFPDTPPMIEDSAKHFRLRTDERQSQPTGRAWGEESKGSGGDADMLWEDDACDRKIAESETSRNRLNDQLVNTWRKRLRKSPHTRTFLLITTTLWNHDDPYCRLINLVKQGKSRMNVLRMGHNGPDDHPPFRSLIPDRVTSAELRSRYHQSPHTYATVEQCNPSAPTARRIKRLRYYLPGDPSHAEFLRRATFCLSLDPTYTKKETSDMAAFVYCAIGDVTEGGETRTVMRVLDARTFHARQGETVMEVAAYTSSHTTHYLHVEQHSGTDATLEHLDNMGIDHISHQIGSLSKAFRLERVAVMLDDGLRDKGFPGACVEFPGVVGEGGRIESDREGELRWLEQEILEFGVAATDHGLDALTQLCWHYLPELSPGSSVTTAQVQRAIGGNERLRRMYENFNRKPGGRAAEMAWEHAELARGN